MFIVCQTIAALAADQPTIHGIQTISTTDATRVVISLSEPIHYELVPELSSTKATTPSHLHLRFSPARLAPDVPALVPGGDARLKELRISQMAGAIVRVSLMLDRLGAYRVTSYRSPDQVVILLRNPVVLRPPPRVLASVKARAERRTNELPPPVPFPTVRNQPRNQDRTVTSRAVKPPVPDSASVPSRAPTISEKSYSYKPQLPAPVSPIPPLPSISHERTVTRDPSPPAPPTEQLERHAALPPPRPAPPPPSIRPEERSDEPSLRTEQYRIMIDPGHGGSDPGARSPDGLLEKDVVLSVSKRLAQKLRSRLGAEVVLTRTTDIFIPLPQRTARANAAKADLFVSIHANASPNSETQGIETYYLNNTNDRATIRLAKLENGIREKQQLPRRESSLSYILSDLIQSGKEEESIALAEAIQAGLVEQVRTEVPYARDLGVKQGPFYVLVGAHMPCILVELAFLTHPDEGQRLGSSSYQDILAEGLFNGVSEFLRTGLSEKNL